jgi:hypothetical protein
MGITEGSSLMGKSGKSKKGSGEREGGQFAPGGGRIGKGTAEPRKSGEGGSKSSGGGGGSAKKASRPRPKDPKSQKAAKKYASRAQAWSKKSAEFSAKAKKAKTPLEKKAFQHASKKAARHASDAAKKAEAKVGKKHPTAQRARKSANSAAKHEKRHVAAEQKTQARTAAREQKAKAKGDAKAAKDQHKSEIKAAKEKWKSDDKSARSSKKESKEWNNKVEKAKAKVAHMDEKQRIREKAKQEQRAEFWQKKQAEHQKKAKASKNGVEKEAHHKVAKAAEAKSDDALAWVKAIGDFASNTSTQQVSNLTRATGESVHKQRGDSRCVFVCPVQVQLMSVCSAVR